MATLVPIPKLGQSEETVSIVKWHKAEGDVIQKGDILFEVETDKAVLEVESQFTGTLLKVVTPADKEVPVMTIACVLGEPGEEIPPIPEPAAPAAEEPAAKPAPAAKPEPPKPQAPAPATPAPAPERSVPAPAPATRAPAPAPKKRAVSPRARKFAADFLIDLDRVSGTGPGDRVVERDVQAYLETSGYLARKITPAALNLARQEKLLLLDLEATGPSGRVTVDDVKRAVAEKPRPMSKMRRIIAQRLQQSKQTIPHFYVTVSVDMTDLAVYRKVLKEQGFALSFNDFVLNAVAESLVDMPSVNSTTDGNTVRWNSRVNVGMAVSIDTGLVVPVLRETDRMSLDEIHDVARELAGKARDGKLLPEEMQGSTFTVSNMGMLNIDEFSAIINPGESAILAVSSIVPSAVVTDDRQIVVRDMMKITLSADHRIVDGADAAAFVNAVKRRLQDMDRWQKQTGVPMPRA